MVTKAAIVFIVLVALLLPLLPTPVSADDSNWWNENWTRRRLVTIKNGFTSDALNNFTILLVVNSTNIDFSQTQNDGDDLRFVAHNNITELPYEIEGSWNETTDNYIWLKHNFPASGETRFWMYYGNATVAAGENVTGTWDDNYMGVWHLTEDPGPGGAGDIEDSTVYQNHGTADGSMTSADLVAGAVGYGLDFDGDNDNVEASDSPSLSVTGALTLEAWVTPNSMDSNGGIIDKETDERCYYLLVFSDGDLWHYISANAAGSTYRYTHNDNQLVTDATLHYIVGNFPGGAGMDLYVDGTLVADSETGSANSIFDNDDPLTIGNIERAAGNEFKGMIDEVRVSNVEWADYWIEATYKTVRGGFATFATEDILAAWPLAPTNLTAVQTDFDTATLTWDADTVNATSTIIMAREGEYPTDPDDPDAFVLYNSSAETVDAEGLDLEAYEYYWRAWGFNSRGLSAGYDETYLGGDEMAALSSTLFLGVLGLLALGLLVAMFATKNSLLGFPSLILWGILAGQAYTLSEATWDLMYILFFGSIFLGVFAMIAAYTLRKKDLEGPDADKGKYIDEGGKKGPSASPQMQYSGDWGDIDNLPMHGLPESGSTKRSAGIRRRAKERREERRLGLG